MGRRRGLHMHGELTEATPTSSAAALSLVGLDVLMQASLGSAEVGIGLVDGPVDDHPELAEARVDRLRVDARAHPRTGSAGAHGTFVAGILAARRGSAAPAICPGCTLLVRPIFDEASTDGVVPTATPDEVASAIVECVDAGARVVNLSAATGAPTTRRETRLRQALDHAARRGALVVAAAGNQGALGSSEITRHPGVMPVVAYGLSGHPLHQSNFGMSAGRFGIGAPGEGIVSLAVPDVAPPRAGTSIAAALVTGALALLWSLHPAVTAASLRRALTSDATRRRSVVPPLMDARKADAVLAAGDDP